MTTQKMKQKVKKLWIKALTSGEYKQGREQLRIEDKFCCLGVLCDLYGKSEGVRWDGEVFQSNLTELPPQVQRWAGLDDADPKLPGRFKYDTLAAQNDNGSNFARIADLIEKYL